MCVVVCAWIIEHGELDRKRARRVSPNVWHVGKPFEAKRVTYGTGSSANAFVLFIGGIVGLHMGYLCLKAFTRRCIEVFISRSGVRRLRESFSTYSIEKNENL